MIDLSYLTEEEQGLILDVLRRDAELKKTEEDRVKNLQKSESDKGRLKYLTGEWFYETKSLRHRDRIHGADLIRASMKHRQKHVAILEFSQMVSEKQDVFVQAELCGLIEEPHTQQSNKRENVFQSSQETQKPVSQSPTKQRQNPFNSASLSPQTLESLEESGGQLSNGIIEQTKTPMWDQHVHGLAETLSPQVSTINLAEQGSGKAVQLETDKEEDGHSVTKVTDGYGWRLKHSKEIQSELAVETSDEMKILNKVTDSNPSNDPVSETTSLLCPGSQKEMFETFSRDESKVSKHPETQIPVQKYPIQSILNSQSTVNNITEKRHVTFKEDVATPDTSEVRTLHLTALQKTKFKDTITATILDSDKTSKKITVKDGDETYPKKLSNLKSFWERENSGPRVIFAKPSASAKTPETNICFVDHRGHDSDDALTNITIAEDSQPLQKSGTDPDSFVCPPQTEEECLDSKISSLSNLDLSQEEGTYRARPILICDEIEDSFEGVNTFSETPLLLEPVTSLTITPSTVILSQQDLQMNKATKINDLKSFWEKEYSGPKIFIGGAKEALSSQTYQLADQCSDDITRKRTTSKSNPITSTIRKDSVDYTLKSSLLGSSDSAVLTETDISQKSFIRSPSKTCHPKALPKESSKQESSPLKTFSIDINPPRLHCEDKCERPMLATGQRRRPSHESKQSESSVMNISAEIISSPPQSSPEGPRQHCHSLVQSSSKQSPLDVSPSAESQQPQHQLFSKASEAVHFVPQCANIGDGERRFADVPDASETCPRLARSFIPQDNEHYLGVAERAYVPHFYKGKTNKETDVIPPAPLSFLEEKQKQHSNEGSSLGTHAWSMNNADNSKQDSKAISFSQHGGGSDSYQASNPIQLERTQLSSKLKSSSKSMENLTSQPTSKVIEKSQSGQLTSVDDVTGLHPMPNFLTDSNEWENMSMSVPVLLLDETYGRDSDCISEDSLHMGWRQKTGSTSSNLSLTSGMATMSSVGSVLSINTSEFGDLEVQGTIQFAMNYVQKLGEFHIFVVLCRDLAIAEPKKHRSDPYVKCYLLPDNTKMGKRKTSVKKKTTNPTYNEILRFKVTMEDLKIQKLNLSVWHNDNFGRNSFLGEVDLDLSEWDFNNTDINDYALKARISIASQSPCHSPCVDHRSKMRVAVRFLPQISYSKRTSETGEVQIWVKDCKNLAPVRGVIIDPFVKCTVLPDTSRKSRQKTRVVKRTANPMFNHTMVYDGFRPEDLKETCMEITVWDHDRLNNHLIGGIRLGLGTGKSYGAEVEWMDSTLDEASLWGKMMQSHSEWVEDVLPLRIFVMARNMSK